MSYNTSNRNGAFVIPLTGQPIFSKISIIPSACPRTYSPHISIYAMADISKPKPGVGGPKGPAFGESDRGGGVAVITKPTTKKKVKRQSKTEHEPAWRVLLHNDDVHTFDYVTGAIVKVCYHFLFFNFLFLNEEYVYKYLTKSSN